MQKKSDSRKTFSLKNRKNSPAVRCSVERKERKEKKSLFHWNLSCTNHFLFLSSATIKTIRGSRRNASKKRPAFLSSFAASWEEEERARKKLFSSSLSFFHYCSSAKIVLQTVFSRGSEEEQSVLEKSSFKIVCGPFFLSAVPKAGS